MQSTECEHDRLKTFGDERKSNTASLVDVRTTYPKLAVDDRPYASVGLSSHGLFIDMYQALCHVYPPDTEDGLGGATSVAGDDLEVRGLAFPRGVERQVVRGEPVIRLYEGRVAIRGEMRVTGDQPRLIVGFQPCGEGRCLAPVRLELEPGS